MKLEIVTYPEQSLTQTCELVSEITPEIKTLIDNMVQTMYADDGVGLAAPQVGQNIQLITLDQSGPRERSELMVIINPVIEESEGEVDSTEGCLSCPGLSVKVKRAERVKVTGIDENGKDVCIEAEALLAIILQHEIDHLNGVTLVDHAGRLKKAMYNKKVKKWKTGK